MFQDIPEVHPKNVQQNSEFKLVDVRKQNEFVGDLGHIPGAILKPLGPELSQWLKQQPKDSKLIFICRSGRRSEEATIEALKLQFAEVYNMTGGMVLWNELGLKTER